MFLEDKFPNYKTESPPIGDLMSFYKQSKARQVDARFPSEFLLLFLAGSTVTSSSRAVLTPVWSSCRRTRKIT